MRTKIRQRDSKDGTATHTGNGTRDRHCQAPAVISLRIPRASR